MQAGNNDWANRFKDCLQTGMILFYFCISIYPKQIKENYTGY
jgi:hypothetical protein